jgi:hypothetical protein
MAEENLLEDEERANERQKLDWAGLIFRGFFFGGGAVNLREQFLLCVRFISLRIGKTHEQ